MFQSFIDDHREEMVESLQGILRIPSVKGPAAPGYPFGVDVGNTLAYVLEFAEDRGFAVKNVDGFAGHVEYGDGPDEDYVAVLTHLDVVPAGEGWSHSPFTAEVVDGQVYARGAIDDKGPAMSALWALCAMKALGLRPKRKIRLVFGLDEESDWKCMEHYFQHEPLPLGGFTPDADFPLIYAEKGVCTLSIVMSADCGSMSPCVIRFEGGHRDNMVPDYASVTVDCHSETAALEWEQKILRDARSRQMEAEVRVKDSQVDIVVHGLSAHGSTPDKGVNAIVLLATLLSGQPVANASMWRFISSNDTTGHALGIEAEDEVTGALTVNLGCASLRDGSYTFTFNIRYPVDLTATELQNRCKAYVSDKWDVRLVHNLDPLHVALDSPVVVTLSRVYEEETGEVSTPIAIGGATYARSIPNAVAFGPLFPGQEDRAHQVDECWPLNDYFRCIQIYAHAMHELANTL